MLIALSVATGAFFNGTCMGSSFFVRGLSDKLLFEFTMPHVSPH